MVRLLRNSVTVIHNLEHPGFFSLNLGSTLWEYVWVVSALLPL